MAEPEIPWEFGTGTRAVADYVLGFDLDSLSEDRRQTLRRTVVDTLGAITAGHAIPENQHVVEYVRATYGEGTATILDGSGRRTTTPGAALANTVAANGLDIDDGNVRAMGHPAAMVVPVALTVAEAQGATVREFLEAVQVGYEVAVRAGEARREVVGYYNGTGSWATVGAAAAAGRARGLNRDRLTAALGIADFNAPLTPVMRSVANPGNGLTKDGIGWGGYTAVTAAELAARGLNGSGTVFDHQAVTAHDDLGEVDGFETQTYKPYPGCRWTHAAIDAVRSLYDEHDIVAADIERVDVYTFEAGMHLQTRVPANSDEAQYSYQFPLAVALLRGDVRPSDLQGQRLDDEDVLAMTERIELHYDPDLMDVYGESWPARVELRTPDETYSKEVIQPLGAEERPLSEEQFREKLRRLFADHPDPEAPERIVEVLSTPAAAVEELVHLWSSS